MYLPNHLENALAPVVPGATLGNNQASSPRAFRCVVYEVQEADCNQLLVYRDRAGRVLVLQSSASLRVWNDIETIGAYQFLMRHIGYFEPREFTKPRASKQTPAAATKTLLRLDPLRGVRLW